MVNDKLTTTQRRLQKEIEEIASAVNMDHWNILGYEPESRTTYLRLVKRKLVIGDIIIKYTLIDEALGVIISHYYFQKPKK